MCIARASCLLLFTHAVRLAFSFAFCQGGQEQAGENGDDRDDHQKLDERERVETTPCDEATQHGTDLNLFTHFGSPLTFSQSAPRCNRFFPRRTVASAAQLMLPPERGCVRRTVLV